MDMCNIPENKMKVKQLIKRIAFLQDGISIIIGTFAMFIWNDGVRPCDCTVVFHSGSIGGVLIP